MIGHFNIFRILQNNLIVIVAVMSMHSNLTLRGNTLYPDSSGISYTKFAIVNLGIMGFITAGHIQSYNSWWKGERSAFAIRDEGGYARGADKMGHLYFSRLSSDLIGRSYHWAGLGERNSYLYGALAAFTFEFYVELEDGFRKDLGFSVGDLAADAVGAAYPLISYHQPYLNNFDLKMSLYPSANYKNDMYRTIIDDYESVYYWLSFDRQLMPDWFDHILPEFVTIAVGYGVKNIVGANGGFSELFLSFDYDLEKLPGEGSFLSPLKHLLNYMHLPAPAVRLSPSVIFYGLKF